ncbi:protein FAM222B [Brachyhypopomus gauderio]|uniref:protein FAM222B n=1 Tax=Brachyhypopomus gauderio TaxID=698409 RepID=UPI004043263D
MNTGPQKWDATQKMRSAPHPTPAELDAYAKKVANTPLTIKIFPSSVKVPQRKHVRRMVNGLDTSSQRYCPYPSQVGTSNSLLAVVNAPVKGLVKDSDGCRARFISNVVMNPQAGSYGAPSTLNPSQPVPRTHALANQPQKSFPRPPLPEAQRGLPHPQLQRKDLPHPPRLQGQHSVAQQQIVRPVPPTAPPPAPHLALVHPHALMQHQAGPSGLRCLPEMSGPAHLQHPQVFSQPLPQASGAGPPPPGGLMQPLHPPPGTQAPGKLPDADAPPNVTVSTSSIPLSMAASLHHNGPGDLSSIVHQISRFCQARAGSVPTSVCEGQIANPSPISRNQLLSASSRVCAHNPALGPPPSCALGPSPGPAPILLPGMGAMNRVPAYHDMKQQHPSQQQRARWPQQHHPHLHPLAEGPHPAKSHPTRDGPVGPGFPIKGVGYPQDVCVGQPFGLNPPIDKSTPPPTGMVPGAVGYSNGHYMLPPWNGVLPTPNVDGSGSQELAVAFHGGLSGVSVDCNPGVQYRSGAGGGHSGLMQPVDYMGGDVQAACYRQQNTSMMGKMRRVMDSGDTRNIHLQHPGYR